MYSLRHDVLTAVKFLALSAFLMFAPQFVTAQSTADNPAPVLADALSLRIGQAESRYALQEGTNYLEIRFCEAARTDYCNWPGRSTNLSGSRVDSGVTIEPAIPGEWRWSSDYSLQFTPKSYWPAGTTYTVKFSANLLPGGISIDVPSWSFTTEPLTPRISEMKFFQDPTDIDKKLISTTVDFNYPVDKESFKQHLQFGLEELEGKQLTAAGSVPPYTVQFNNMDMQAVITSTITSLPDKERFLTLTLTPGITAKNGGAAFVQDPKRGKYVERVQIPSLYSYAQVNYVESSLVKNQKLEPEQAMTLEFNTPVSEAELTSHLSLRLLPKDKQSPVKGQSAKKDYAWAATEVTADVLKESIEIPFNLLPVAGDDSTIHSLKFSTEPQRWVLVTVKSGMKLRGGYVLGKDYVTTTQSPQFPREVKIMPQGSILSLHGDKKIQLYSIGIDEMEVEVGRIIPGNLHHFISQSYGSFSQPNMNYSFGPENFTERFTTKLQGNTSLTSPHFNAFDFGEYLKAQRGNRGLFFFRVKKMEKDKDGNIQTVAEDNRFVVLTDIGFMVKKNADGTQEVFAQSLEDGEPVHFATVEVLGKNGLPIFRGRTDSDGHVQVPNLSGFEVEKAPVAFVVTKGDDLSFMPYDNYERKVNLSRFDTSGNDSVQGGMRAYLFSDRGIYRPGETAHIGILVKQGDWTTDLSGLPLTVELSNPRGQVIEKKAVALNREGLVEYQFSTKDTSATGYYNVRLYITGEKGSDLIGSTGVRVEEFLPDTLKITSRFNKQDVKGWVSPSDLSASINLMNLYGTPAENHVVQANISLAPAWFSFDAFKEYSFFDAKAASNSFDQPLADQRTDAQGNVTFPLDLSSYGDSSYRLTFYGEGFEEGSGRGVKTATSILVSSLPYVVGYKADGTLDYINKDSARSINFVAVDPSLAAIDASDLKLEKVKVTYISTLVKQGDGKYAYQSLPKETLEKSDALVIAAKGADYALDTSTPGNYVLYIKNAAGMTLSRISYSIAGDAMTQGATERDAVVNLTLNKKQYAPGDTIEMNIVSPYTGSGLITVETDKVVTWKWFEASTSSSVQSIKIPSDFEGNGYVNVQFVRAIDSREIYTSPLSTGVAGFSVDTDARNSGIELGVPETVKPGQDLVISYKTREPSRILIFAVDEGILQYGRYQNPDPISYLLASRALQVETSQIYDLLMPEYSVMRSVSSTGGDGSLDNGKNLNPFKRKTQPPVAFWSGLLEADSTAKEVTYRVPDYFNGKLRVLAVAASPLRIGAKDSASTVRGDIILAPNAPLFVAPGDEFEITSTLANHVQGSGDKAELSVIAALEGPIEVVGDSKLTVTVPEGKEVGVKLRLRAKDEPGAASILFTAGYKDSAAKYEATLSVRPASPKITRLAGGFVAQDEKTVPVPGTMYAALSEAEASASGMPLSLVPGLARFLANSPYGCTEQITSSAMPHLLLFDHPELSYLSENSREKVVDTISQLVERARPDGAFGLWWSGDGEVSEFVSIYALHLLTLAKEKNLPIPAETMQSTLNYVKQLSAKAVVDLPQARVHAYGIYLLTRNGEITTNYLPYLLQYLEDNHKDSWKHDLAGVYLAATYQLLQMTPEADALISEFLPGEPVEWTNYKQESAFYDSLIRYSQYLYILSEHFPTRLDSLDKKVLQRIAGFVGEGSVNTLASSYAIMALNSYSRAIATQTKSTLSISAKGEDGNFIPLEIKGEVVRRASFPPLSPELKFSGAGNSGMYYQISKAGFESVLPQAAIHDGIEVTHSYTDKDGKPVESAKLGDRVTVTVTLRSYNDQSVDNIAILDLLPGGFEVDMDSIRPVVPGQEGSMEPAASEGEMDVESAPDDLTNPSSMATNAVDVREDRVVLYTQATPDARQFVYRIKAVNAGSFVVPPAYAESMYLPTIRARGIAGKLRVE